MRRRTFLKTMAASSSTALLTRFDALEARSVAATSVLRDYAIIQYGILDPFGPLALDPSTGHPLDPDTGRPRDPDMFNASAGAFLNFRPNTCLIATPFGTIQEFIAYLNAPTTEPAIIMTRSVGGVEVECGPAVPRLDHRRHLIIATHSNNRGGMYIGLDENHRDKLPDDRVEYEHLLDAEYAGTLRIPSGMTIDGTAVTATNTVVRLMGCRVGQTPQFLQQLKQALGAGIPVTAPNHWTHVEPVLALDAGVLEYMQYVFEHRSTDELSYDDLLTAFDQKWVAATAQYNAGNVSSLDVVWRTWFALNGNVAPDWRRCIPTPPRSQRAVPRARSVGFNAKFKRPLAGHSQFPLPANAGRPGGIEFNWQVERVGSFRCPGGPDAKVASQSAIHAFLKPCLATLRPFDPGTGFALYQRHGMASIEEFLDAFRWDQVRSEPDLWFGTRQSYSCSIPIRDTDGTLICNYVTSNAAKSAELFLDEILSDPARKAVADLLFTTV